MSQAPTSDEEHDGEQVIVGDRLRQRLNSNVQRYTSNFVIRSESSCNYCFSR